MTRTDSLDDFEGFRDFYKNSRQSLNGIKGATWRRRNINKNNGDIIHKKENNIKNNNDTLDQIDRKYALNTSTGLSLNKKYRWNLSNELSLKMNDYKQDQIDVRLFESQNINKKKSSTCLKFYRSKVNEDNTSNLIKSGKGNLNSIKKQLLLYEKQKHQQIISEDKMSNNKNQENIIIDLRIDPNEDKSEYIEYNIEHNSAKARQGHKKASKFIVGTLEKKKIGNRSRNYKLIHNQETDDSTTIYDEDDLIDNELQTNQHPINNVTLAHLINSDAKNLIAKRVKNTQKINEKFELKPKNKFIYFIDLPVDLSLFKFDDKSIDIKVQTSKRLSLILKIDKESTDQQYLNNLYGSFYSEGIKSKSCCFFFNKIFIK
jgi:hypothetical protein